MCADEKREFTVQLICKSEPAVVHAVGPVDLQHPSIIEQQAAQNLVAEEQGGSAQARSRARGAQCEDPCSNSEAVGDGAVDDDISIHKNDDNDEGEGGGDYLRSEVQQAEWEAAGQRYIHTLIQHSAPGKYLPYLTELVFNKGNNIPGQIQVRI